MESPRAVIKDLRRFERLCLEQAELCVLEESRQALRKVAGDYRAAAANLSALARQRDCRHGADTRVLRNSAKVRQVLDLIGSPGWSQGDCQIPGIFEVFACRLARYCHSILSFDRSHGACSDPFPENHPRRDARVRRPRRADLLPRPHRDQRRPLGRTMSGCRTSSRASSAPPAAGAAPRCGPLFEPARMGAG